MADLESIYRQYSDTVFRFLMSKTGSVELAEELTQETFYQAVKSIDRYDGSSRITSWLCGIAQNVLYAHLRARQKDPLPLEDVPEQDPGDPRGHPGAARSRRGDHADADLRRSVFQADRRDPGPHGSLGQSQLLPCQAISDKGVEQR